MTKAIGMPFNTGSSPQKLGQGQRGNHQKKGSLEILMSMFFVECALICALWWGHVHILTVFQLVLYIMLNRYRIT